MTPYSKVKCQLLTQNKNLHSKILENMPIKNKVKHEKIIWPSSK